VSCGQNLREHAALVTNPALGQRGVFAVQFDQDCVTLEPVSD
jgi:hypothetical protein